MEEHARRQRQRRKNSDFLEKERKANKNRGLTKEGRLGWLYANAKYRAKKKGIPFEIEKSDLEIPEKCPVLGIPIELGLNGKKRRNPNSPSIDRINNKKGYVRGNVAIISLRANVLKSDAELEEMKKVVLYMESSK